LKIPFNVTWRNDFTGTSIKLKAFGEGLAGVKELEIPVKAATAEAVLDFAALKTPPGEYTLAFYGSGVSKYRYNPAAVPLAEAEQKKAEQLAATAAADAKKIAATDANAAKTAAEKQKQADALMTQASKRMKSVSAAAEPKDTVDIVVTQPVRISVKETQVATTAANAK
jgi:hypothetical protein